MADQQGTGKHPHKSAAEPYEHHEAPTTKGKSESHTSGSHSTSGAASHSTGKDTSHSTSHASSSTHETGGEQGTGKHPHKKASDPHEHHEGAKSSK